MLSILRSARRVVRFALTMPAMLIVGARMAGTQVTRPQPQTTADTAGRPASQEDAFLAATMRAQRPGYNITVTPGNAIDNPLPGAPGYLSYYDLFLNAASGANATTNSVAGQNTPIGADFGVGTGITTAARSAIGASPAALFQYVQVQDAHGTPVFSGNGWEMLYLLPEFSGQFGILGAVDLAKQTTYSTAGLGTGTSTANTGNFFLHTRIPFEIVPGYGLLGIGDQNLQPRLHLQPATLATLYQTAPSTAPTISLVTDEGFYGVPQSNPQLTPVGLSTTLQAIQVTANPTVGSASSNRVQIARLGGWLVGLILVARDANGFRNDNVWPAFGSNNRIRLYLDGVPIIDEPIEARFDAMYHMAAGGKGQAFQPSTASANVTDRYPAGVVAYTWKDFESNANLGRLDNGLGWINTRPGTQLEIECTPWGTFSNGPAQISAIVCVIVPGRGGRSQSFQ